MWQLLSATTSEDVSSQVIMAFDPDHVNGYDGGSELAVPWDVLYGLGPGQVPAFATIGVVASVCWDPEPDGELGGDVVPNNVVTTLPAIDNFCEIQVDTNGNGLPDPLPTAAPEDGPRTTQVFGAAPNPSRATTSVRVLLTAPSVGGSASYEVRAEVYDLAGRRVKSVFEGHLPSGSHSFLWDGHDGTGRATGSGVYFLRVVVDGQPAGTAKITRMQ